MKISKLLQDLSCFMKYECVVNIMWHTEIEDYIRRIAKMRSGRETLIACCGNIETFNAAVNGVAGSDPLPILWYIPAKNLKNHEIALYTLLKKDEREKHLGIGSLNGRGFVDRAVFGTSSDISYFYPHRANLKNMFGFFGAVKAYLKIIRSMPHDMTIMANGKDYSGTYILCSVTHTGSAGHIIKRREEYDLPENGALEVFLLEEPDKHDDYVRLISDIRRGKLINNPFVRIFRTDCIDITTDDYPWLIDGMYSREYHNISIKNIPEALRILL